MSNKALIGYANEDFSKWLYLCKQCHERLIARTVGIIPLSLFKGDADGKKEPIIGTLPKKSVISSLSQSGKQTSLG